jgi:hypothetical protein
MTTISVSPAPKLLDLSKTPAPAIVLTYDPIKEHYISPTYYLKPQFFQSGVGGFDDVDLLLVIPDEYQPDVQFIAPTTHLAQFQLSWMTVTGDNLNGFLYSFILSADKELMLAAIDLQFVAITHSGAEQSKDSQSYTYGLKFNP